MILLIIIGKDAMYVPFQIGKYGISLSHDKHQIIVKNWPVKI